MDQTKVRFASASRLTRRHRCFAPTRSDGQANVRDLGDTLVRQQDVAGLQIPAETAFHTPSGDMDDQAANAG